MKTGRHEIFQKMSGLEGIKVSVLPSTLDMIHRKPIHTQLREIRIEDILGREPVYLDPTPVDAYITGEVIMVTGGGGSIGSELCRQIVKHDPKELVIVDIYENGAYDIQQELLYQYGGRLNLKVEIASVQDKARMRQIFEHIIQMLYFMLLHINTYLLWRIVPRRPFETMCLEH